MTEEGNPAAFVTQSSKSNYQAVIVRPEQAFRIMMELEDPYRTVVFLVAVTGLRISEALGLKWGDLDYCELTTVKWCPKADTGDSTSRTNAFLPAQLLNMQRFNARRPRFSWNYACIVDSNREATRRVRCRPHE
jgi:hypothetical protein